MNVFIKGLMGGAAAWLANSFRGFAREFVTLHASIWYLRAVRTAHRVYLLSLVATLSTALVGAGFVLFHIGLFAVLPAPVNAIVLMVLGLTYLVVGLCIIRALSSEKRWMAATGADKCASLAGRHPDD